MGKEPLLQLENLKVDFFLRSGKATAIHGLDLQLERGKPSDWWESLAVESL